MFATLRIATIGHFTPDFVICILAASVLNRLLDWKVSCRDAIEEGRFSKRDLVDCVSRCEWKEPGPGLT